MNRKELIHSRENCTYCIYHFPHFLLSFLLSFHFGFVYHFISVKIVLFCVPLLISSQNFQCFCVNTIEKFVNLFYETILLSPQIIPSIVLTLTTLFLSLSAHFYFRIHYSASKHMLGFRVHVNCNCNCMMCK